MEAYIGQIIVFAGVFVPAGWLLCDGSLVTIDAYPTLFQLLGTTYGGDGSTNFGLPNLVGRLAIGTGVAQSGTSYALGQQGGATSVTLTTDNLPAHTHALNITANPTTASPGSQQLVANQGSAAPSAFVASTNVSLTAMANGSIGPAGSGQPHANVQPVLACLHCICTEGVFPS